MHSTMIFANCKETTWGWRYLAFQTLFLGYFLELAVKYLGLPLNVAQLNFVYFSLNFVVALILFRQMLWTSLKAAWNHLERTLLVAIGGFVVYYILTIVVSTIILTIDPSFANINDQAISSISRQQYILTAIGTVLLAPTAEELFHRGAIFGGLYRKKPVVAYVVSIVLFALVHIYGYIGHCSPLTLLLCFSQYVPAGICLAASYRLSGCIVTSILIHTAVNAIGMLAMR